MHTSTTTIGRRLVMLLVFAGVAVFSAQAQRTVTLQLNTATLADTVSATDEIWLRGAIDGTAPFTLPDGNVIDWGEATTLAPMNTGGDYWELEFQIPDDQAMAFKAFVGTASEGVDGWEKDPNNSLDAGTGDVDLGLHYFDGVGNQPYDWSPFDQKEDSIGVHFRVYMNTEGANGAGYLGDGTDVVGVRGQPNGSVPNLSWDTTELMLSQESEDQPAVPGYHLYSGVAYFPVTAAGTVQEYKFFTGDAGWEGSPNRTFTIPAQDSTLHWQYFGDSPPLTQQPVEADVTFSVDLDPLERIGVFSRARGDTLQIRGTFNNWECLDPSRCELEKEFGLPVFSQVIGVNLVPGFELEYKYFIDYDIEDVQDEWGVDVIPSGWEEPLGTQGGNRSVIFEGQDLAVPQVYNDVQAANIIPAGNNVEVHFSVDMATATTAAEPFDPAADSVTVTIQDPVFSLTQGFQLTPRGTEGDDQFLGDAVSPTWLVENVMLLEDPDEDLVYEGSFTISGPTYNGLQYKYTYGSPSASTWTDEAGSDASGPGRRRTRFILPNQDGSWPADWSYPDEEYQPSGALPFEPNPALDTAIEAVDGEVPSQVSLSENFPNPFNPTTSFEYTIDRTLDVKLNVYDVLGRQVATLVDGTQSASTYRVTFDASSLASGTYIYRLETPNQVITKTMVLLK